MSKIYDIPLISIFLISVSAEFQLVRDWPDPSIAAMRVYGSGIALDGDGNLLVLHRGGIMLPGYPPNTTIPGDVLLVVDGESGIVLRRWGANMFNWPHGVEVTSSGDIFITDSRFHQVLKFAHNSSTKLWNTSPILTLGDKFISGADETHFCTPADVALAGDGSFYVADGYCNSRIVKFDRNGRYLLSFTAGSGNPFNITHGVALAPRTVDDFLVFVADRDNSRLQAFTSNGIFRIFSVSHVPSDKYEYGVIYAVNGYLPWGEAEVFEIGVTARNWTLISSFKTSPGSVDPNGYEAPHDIIASKDGKSIYVVISIADSLVLKKYKLVDDGSGGSERIAFGCGGLVALFHFMLRF